MHICTLNKAIMIEGNDLLQILKKSNVNGGKVCIMTALLLWAPVCSHIMAWWHLMATQIWLTHWGRVMHLCIGKLTIIGSDNSLSPGWRQANIWTNAGILSIDPLGTNVRETLIKNYIFSFKKMYLKMSSGKWRPFCLGLNVLIVRCHQTTSHYLNHFYLSSVRSGDINLRAIAQGIPQWLIVNISINMTYLKSYSYSPGANEFMERYSEE